MFQAFKRISERDKNAVNGYIRTQNQYMNNMINYSIVQLITMYYYRSDSFDTQCKGDRILIKGVQNELCTTSVADGYNSAFGIELAKPNTGLHKWSIEINEHNEKSKIHSWKYVIGIVKALKSPLEDIKNTYLTRYKSSYVFVANFNNSQSFKAVRGSSDGQYAKLCKKGDVVDMYLDTDNNTLRYAVNGTLFDIAYHVVTDTYKLAVTVHDPETTLKLLEYTN